MYPMMLFKTLLILTVFGVALCENEICSTSVTDVCNYYEKNPKDYPETVEELRKDCNNVQELGRCFLDYQEECLSLKIDTSRLEKLLLYLEEQCQEDSEAFQVISRNIDCFTPTIRSVGDKCVWPFLEEEEIEILIDQSRNVFPDYEYECLEALWQITCKARSVGQRCGSELTEILYDILKNTNYSYERHCKTDKLSEFLSFKQAIERVFEEGEWLKNYEELKNGEGDEEDVSEEYVNEENASEEEK